MPEKQLYTVKELASILMRSEDSVRRLKYKIGYIRDGKQILFKASDISKYINSHYFKPRPINFEGKRLY